MANGVVQRMQKMTHRVTRDRMGRQGVMNRCWEDKNRTEQGGKESEDRDTE